MGKEKVEQVTDVEDKVAAVKKATGAINRKYGAGTITSGIDPVERVHTGLASYDLLTRQFLDGKLMSYGLPRGQYTMIWGANDVGKSCLAFQLINATQHDYATMFIDGEYSMMQYGLSRMV